MTIFIVGHGIVGQRLRRLLVPQRVVYVDPRSGAVPASAGGDVAVLAHPDEHAELAEQFGERGTSVVTVGDDFGDAAALLALGDLFTERAATLVVGAAMSPGLSGLLARHLAEQLSSVDEIHVAIHGTAGPACARAYHRSLSGRAPGWHDDRWIDYVGGTGRELCWFPEPVGALDCYRADAADTLLLHTAFPDVQRISAKRSARRRDRFTAWLPMLSPPHDEGGVGALRVEVRGAGADGARECSIVGVAELVGTTTAATVAAFTQLVLAGRLAKGVVIAGSAEVPTLETLAQIERYGVRLQEFTGVAQSR